MPRILRPAVLFAIALVAGTTAPAASPAPRMLMGFHDDPTFRWSPEAQANLDRAAVTGISVIRTIASWRAIAPTRPANPTDSFDPAYRFDDLDDLVRSAGQRGIEVLISIWGTPAWANGGRRATYAPTDPNDLRAFAQALADRYSGRHPGYPYVRRWSVWNEPNLEIFLAPQFDAKGAIVSPRIYATIYRAAWAGIKAANPQALVAIGETSARGRNHVKKGVSGAVSPARFAQLLAQADPHLRFDAWAHHPYPTEPSLRPLQNVDWPNVTLSRLHQFEASIDTWFRHRGTPIWITEYGHETRPGEPKGVSNAQQAAYARIAVKFAQADPRVQLFIWFIFRDSPASPWQSGFYAQDGNAKAGLDAWTNVVASADGFTVNMTGGLPNQTVRADVPKIAYYSGAGATVGLTYRVYDAGKLIAIGQPAVPLGIDGTIAFPVDFTPAAGRTYTLTVDANDINGNVERVVCALVAH